MCNCDCNCLSLDDIDLLDLPEQLQEELLQQFYTSNINYIQGPPGLQGIQGPAGANGAQGIQGIQGPQGPAGPNNLLFYTVDYLRFYDVSQTFTSGVSYAIPVLNVPDVDGSSYGVTPAAAKGVFINASIFAAAAGWIGISTHNVGARGTPVLTGYANAIGQYISGSFFAPIGADGKITIAVAAQKNLSRITLDANGFLLA